jgi:hypothetical protein
VFNLDFTTAKTWDGPTAGTVAAGAEFHTGASFVGSTEVIVARVQMLNSGTPLPLAPRLPGYNAGTADLASGDFEISFFDVEGADDLVLRDIRIRSLPRMLDINAMVDDARLVDIRGEPIEPRDARESRDLAVEKESSLRIGNLADKRSVDILYTEKDCPVGSTGFNQNGDSEPGEEVYCHRGNALSLFPATYTYIVATVVQPNAEHWDPAQGRLVRGDLETKLFYQVGGIVPDFDENGVDDLIDIRGGRAEDDNGNGVIDGAENASQEREGGESDRPWWWLLVLLLILLLVVILLMRRRRST